ncbi:MAG: ABC transporter substrate-binding protein [Anaerolineae bacterium]
MKEGKKKLDRRGFLRMAAMAAAGAAAAACQPQTVIVEKEVKVTEVVKEVVKETVVVEGTPKVVEKEVTKVVEKVVTPTEPAPTPKPTLKPGEVAREDTLIFDTTGRATDPTNFNPFAPSGWRGGHGQLQTSLEPLFLLNYETGEMMPWIGESFAVSDDLMEWTFVIRKGVKWSDGEACDADDLVFTLETLVANAPELRNSTSMEQWIDAVEKVDDFTVKVGLKNPNPRFVLDYFGAKIGSPPIHVVPEHVFKDVEDHAAFKFYDPDQGWPLGTGPYKLNRGEETVCVWDRRDEYWGAEMGVFKMPEPLRVVYQWHGTEEQRSADLVAGLIDYIEDVSPGALIAMKQKNENIHCWYDDLPFAWLDPCARDLEINCTVAPWDDKEMRWALNYLTDREEVVNVAYEGSTKISVTPFPFYPPMEEFVLGAIPDIYDRVDQYNPDKAYEIFQSKGYTRNNAGFWEKDGQLLSLSVQAHAAYVEMKKIPMVLVEQYQRGGVDAVLRVLEGSVWSENLALGTFEASCGWQSCGSINEPWATLDNYSNRHLMPVGERAGSDYWRWDNQEFSDLVEKLGQLALDDPEVIPTFNRAMAILVDEMPVIPVTQARKILPFNTTYWKNFPTAKENPLSENYCHPPSWWSIVHYILQNVERA